jgi:hypothetical protein
MAPDQVRRYAASVLFGVAATEEHLAEIFASLAAKGRPEHRERRAVLAQQARDGAATATNMAERFEARIGGGDPRPVGAGASYGI